MYENIQIHVSIPPIRQIKNLNSYELPDCIGL